MPDESCRKCGGQLANCTQCAECKEVVSMICQQCGSRTMEQFHSHCMYNITNFQNSSLEENQENEFVKVTAFA
jgi:hypothetical protein